MDAQTDQHNAETVLTSHFSVNDLPPQRRFEVWRDSISCIFDVDRRPSQARDEEFHATLDAHMIGSLMMARTVTSGQSFRRSPVTMARDGMDHYMLQIYIDGTQRVRWRGGEMDMPPGSILVYDLAQEISAETTDFVNLSLALPRVLIADRLQAPDDQHMRLLLPGDPLAALVYDHMLALERQAARLDFHQAAAVAPITVDLVAACLNRTAGGQANLQPVNERVLLSSLRRDIELRLTDPDLTPADLCQAHGLSRTRLYEIFAPFGGVASYVKERRLRAALLALADPAQAHLPISAIARAHTFSDSDFSRAFQRRYGLSPRAARHYGLQPRERIDPADLDRRYEHWLRDLTP